MSISYDGFVVNNINSRPLLFLQPGLPVLLRPAEAVLGAAPPPRLLILGGFYVESLPDICKQMHFVKLENIRDIVGITDHFHD